MRGRVMKVPDIEGLRPTSSRVREAVFNSLGDVQGLSFLDLFAGSGVMALEALSRGVTSAYSLEQNRQACQAMRVLEEAWSVEHWNISTGILPHALSTLPSHFDIIYADPPYQQGFAAQIIPWLSNASITYQSLIIEEASAAHITWAEPPYKQRQYGESTLYFFADGRQST